MCVTLPHRDYFVLLREVSVCCRCASERCDVLYWLFWRCIYCCHNSVIGVRVFRSQILHLVRQLCCCCCFHSDARYFCCMFHIHFGCVFIVTARCHLAGIFKDWIGHVNIAHDWRTPLHTSRSTDFDQLEIGLTRVKPAAKKNTRFFTQLGKGGGLKWLR